MKRRQLTERERSEIWQRYKAVMAVLGGGRTVTEVARDLEVLDQGIGRPSRWNRVGAPRPPRTSNQRAERSTV